MHASVFKEDLLLDNDDEAVMAHLDRLSGERQEQEEQAAQADEKTPGWISLRMTQADKRFLIPVWVLFWLFQVFYSRF